MNWPPPLELVPLQGSAPEPALIRRLARRLKHVLGTRVAVRPPLDILLPDREQDRLSSNWLVDVLVLRCASQADPPTGWTVLLTDIDLAAPGRSFVFGEATLDGPCAVVSSARLRAAEVASDRLFERLFKEVVHEIGHLAALPHCRRPRCVMHPSTSVDEVDRKEAHFCDRCEPSFFRVGAP